MHNDGSLWDSCFTLFRPIQQDLCPQQNSLLIVSGFSQKRKNLSLLYFCKWLHVFSAGKLTKSPFF